MKLRSSRIKIVVELAQREEEKAASLFQQARDELETEHQRLRELEEYYTGYQDYFGGGQASVRASDLQKSRLFLQQLADAISNQQQHILRVESAVDQRRSAWHICHLKHKSLLDLSKRYRDEESLVLNKKEQKLLDEWFNQISARKE